MGQFKDNRQLHTNFMNVDMLVTFFMWLLVATTEIHLKTCFCAVYQDLRPPFFQDFFSAHPSNHATTQTMKLQKSCAVYLRFKFGNARE